MLPISIKRFFFYADALHEKIEVSNFAKYVLSFY